jgi:hypothetical protein
LPIKISSLLGLNCGDANGGGSDSQWLCQEVATGG